MELEIMEVQDMKNLQMYQQDKAAMEIAIETAHRYPRNLKKAIDRCITLVTIDAEAADACTYSLVKGGKTITGASVHLAKIVAQQMGNMRVENRVVDIGSTHVTCEAVCIDFETNYGVRTQLKKSIIGSNGRYSEDMITITANAANSIVFRNAVFSVVDAGVIRKIYSAAKARITGDVSDDAKLFAKRNAVVDGYRQAYHSYNLTEEEIAKSVGRLRVDQITADDLVVLIGFEKALATGEATIESLFRPQAARFTPPKADTSAKENERLLLLISSAKDKASLKKLLPDCITNEQREAYDSKFKTL